MSEAWFSETTSKGFTAQQLYSTASYQAKDLHGIGLDGNDLTEVYIRHDLGVESGQHLGGMVGQSEEGYVRLLSSFLFPLLDDFLKGIILRGNEALVPPDDQFVLRDGRRWFIVYSPSYEGKTACAVSAQQEPRASFPWSSIWWLRLPAPPS